MGDSLPVGPKPFFQCPHCQSNLTSTKACAACNRKFHSSDRLTVFDSETLEQITTRSLTSEEQKNEYQRHLARKHLRPTPDFYASFQLFNESYKAVDLLGPWLQNHLPETGVILNLWDRTGLSGDHLAGLFPNHRVLTHWGSSGGALGFIGYQHWFETQKDFCHPNHEVVFFDIAQPWPLQENSVCFVLGFDTLHRYPTEILLTEAKRVTHSDGVIFFPHVHTDHQDSTYERDGETLSLKALEQTLEKNFPKNLYTHCTFSEKAFFEEQEIVHLQKEQTPGHYNGHVLIAPASADVFSVIGAKKNTGREKVILNPFLAVNETVASLQEKSFSYQEEYETFKKRHLYNFEKLLRPLPLGLSENKRILLYWAKRGESLVSLSHKTGLSEKTIQDELQDMISNQSLQCLPLSDSGMQLFRYYSEQFYFEDGSKNNLFQHLRRQARLHPHKTALCSPAHEISLSYSEGYEGVLRTAQLLTKAGVNRQTLVCLQEPFDHPVSWFLFWACQCLGSSLLVSDKTSVTLPKSFSDKAFRIGQSKDCDMALGATSQEWEETFLAKIADMEPITPKKQSNASAMIWLPSSGTSGQEKYIGLRPQSLIDTSRSFIAQFALSDDDVFLTTGPLWTMSGLRNRWVLPALCGGTSVLSESDGTQQLAQILKDEKASVLSTAPPFMKALLAFAHQVLPLKDLRLSLSTAMPLSDDLKKQYEKTFDHTVFNYYGLTETGGLCLSQTPKSPNHLGEALGCVLKLEKTGDEQKTALLFVYSSNVYRGLIENGEFVQHNSFWVDTGDLVSVHEDSNLSLKGRASRLLSNLQGEKSHPEWLEKILESHPQVQTACVFNTLIDHVSKIVACLEVSSLVSSQEMLTWLKQQNETQGFLPQHWLILQKDLRLPSGKPNLPLAISLVEKELTSDE